MGIKIIAKQIASTPVPTRELTESERVARPKLDRARGLLESGRYKEAIPLFRVALSESFTRDAAQVGLDESARGLLNFADRELLRGNAKGAETYWRQAAEAGVADPAVCERIGSMQRRYSFTRPIPVAVSPMRSPSARPAAPSARTITEPSVPPADPAVPTARITYPGRLPSFELDAGARRQKKRLTDVGLAHYRDGRLSEAEQTLRQVLEIDSDDIRILCFMYMSALRARFRFLGDYHPRHKNRLPEDARRIARVALRMEKRIRVIKLVRAKPFLPSTALAMQHKAEYAGLTGPEAERVFRDISEAKIALGFEIGPAIVREVRDRICAEVEEVLALPDPTAEIMATRGRRIDVPVGVPAVPVVVPAERRPRERAERVPFPVLPEETVRRKAELVSTAGEHIRDNRFAEAVEVLAAVIDLDPNDMRVHVLLGLQRIHAQFPFTVTLPPRFHFPKNAHRVASAARRLERRLEAIDILKGNPSMKWNDIRDRSLRLYRMVGGSGQEGKIFDGLEEARVVAGIAYDPVILEKVRGDIDREVVKALSITLDGVTPVAREPRKVARERVTRPATTPHSTNPERDALVSEARSKIDGKQHAEAIPILDRALELDPNSYLARALLMYARVYRQFSFPWLNDKSRQVYPEIQMKILWAVRRLRRRIRVIDLLWEEHRGRTIANRIVATAIHRGLTSVDPDRRLFESINEARIAAGLRENRDVLKRLVDSLGAEEAEILALVLPETDAAQADAAKRKAERDTLLATLRARDEHLAPVRRLFEERRFSQAAKVLEPFVESEPNNVLYFCYKALAECLVRYPDVSGYCFRRASGQVSSIYAPQIRVARRLWQRIRVMEFLSQPDHLDLSTAQIHDIEPSITTLVRGPKDFKVFNMLSEARVAAGIVPGMDVATAVVARIRAEVEASMARLVAK